MATLLDTRLVAHMLTRDIRQILTTNPEDFRRFGAQIIVWTVRDVLGTQATGESAKT